VSKELYAEIQAQLLLIVGVVAEMPLQEFIVAGERAQSIGPYIDPTLWRQSHKKLDAVMELAISLRVFQMVIERQMEEIAAA
jgi:hypothetical protein